MVKKKQSRKRSSRLPPTGIGLITFLDERAGGPEIRPEILIGLSIAFIAICVILVKFFPAA